MKYKYLKKAEFNSSLLGFGAMRLPLMDDDSGNIDEESAIRLIRYAIDKGINYIDTAYPYHKGKSEVIVGKALKDGYRDKVRLTTKSPVWLIKKKSDFDMYLDQQLTRLDTDYIDFYFLHALNSKYWDITLKHDLTGSMVNAVKDGRIRHIGFSYHSDSALFKKIIDSFDWDICMIQYNYIDMQHQAGREGLVYAAEKGISVAVMEPLRGGNLVRGLPRDICEILGSAERSRSLVEWALGWLIEQKEVSIIVSGMSDIEQVKENIKVIDEHIPFTDSDHEIIQKVYRSFITKQRADCTGCGYCDVCPKNIMISAILSLYNDVLLFDSQSQEKPRQFYKGIMNAGRDISSCDNCRKCERICPQGLGIIELLKEADIVLKQK